MEREALTKRVADYFERTYSEQGLERHEPEEEGHWTWKATNERGIPEVVYNGKFSDAVALAITRGELKEKGIVRKVHEINLPKYNIPRQMLRDFNPIVE